MYKQKISIISIIFLLLTNSLISGELQKSLIEHGFESVLVKEYDSVILVSYENRVFRDEARALLEVMKIAGECITDSSKRVDFVLLNREIPFIVVSLKSDELQLLKSNPDEAVGIIDLMEFSDNVDKYIDIIEREKVNDRRYKFDLVITPKFRAELDEFGDPVKIQAGLAPGIETSFGKGSLIMGEFIIPLVHRTFRVGEPEDSFRPGLVNLNQTIRFPGSFYFSTSLGLFSNQRYGIDLELRKFFEEGRVSLGGRVGYTGSGRLYEGEWRSTMIDNFIYFVDSHWDMPWYNLSLAANYGKYIYEDKGFRIDLNRSFGEVEIGFFVMRTKSNLLGDLTSGGFNFSIPIFPSEYGKPGIVRIRPAKSFRWEYNYQHFIHFRQKSYDTGHDLRSFFKKIQPYYIKMRFKHLITGK